MKKQTPSDVPDSIAVRLKTLRHMVADSKRIFAQSQQQHVDTLQKIARMVEVQNFLVDMKENVDLPGPGDTLWTTDLYVKWTRKGTAPMELGEMVEVRAMVHALKGLGYRLQKEQESAHDVEAWFVAK